MSGINVNEVIDLGACNLVVGGVNLGHTDEVGTKAMVKGKIIEAKAGKYGDVAVKRFMDGQQIDIEGVLIQTNFDNLGSTLPLATVVTDGSGNKKLTFGAIAGSVIPTVTVVLSSFLSGNAPIYNLSLKATPVGDFELLYSGNGIQKWKFKFSGVIDEAAGANGSYGFTFGDPTITQDVTPPAVSAVVPTNAQTGRPTSQVVTWTISKDLNPDTVNALTVTMFKNATGPTGLQVAGTVVLANAGAATTITFTPSAPLTSGSVDYICVLSGIKDKAGNALPFYANQFTTT